jgi:hypothetical protein
MNSIINKMFYDYENFNSEEQILKLQKYSIQFCIDNIEKQKDNNILEKINVCNKIEEKNDNIINNQQDLYVNEEKLVYYPMRESYGSPHPSVFKGNNMNSKPPSIIDKEDTIFWCIYIHIYGKNDFLQIGSKYKNHMLEEKTKIINKIKNNPKDFKNKCNYKISNNMIQEIMSDLYVFKNKNIMSTLSTVMAYTYYYNIKIQIYNDNNTYLHFYNINEHEEQLQNNNVNLYYYKGEFGIETEDSDYFEKNKDNYYKTNFIKPLNGISTYKMSELENIAKKLKIYNPELKKSELYCIICQKCLWK